MCRHLIGELGCQVVVIDKLTYAGSLTSLAPVSSDVRFHFEKRDICDTGAIAEVFAQYEPDALIHLAAESHVDRSIDGSDVFVKTNVLGTYTLLEATRRYLAGRSNPQHFRFLHVSTDEVYGSLGESGLFTESTPYDPSSPYSATKGASDHLAKAWFRTYGLPVVVSNCSNNYGPYHFPEKLIPLTILNALERKPLPVYGTGSNVRDWLYVEDHARALALVLQRGRPGETYNIGGRNERQNIDVVRQICSLMDRLRPSQSSHHDLITFVSDRPGHDHRYAIDASKLESELGWRARETFDTGLEKTIVWYLENEHWWRPLREKLYDGARLGLVKA